MLYHPPLLPMPEIPLPRHPGAFGTRRKYDVHSGIDLYAPHGETVYAVEDGRIVYADWFTGEKCNTPWWNNTRALYIEGDTATMVYGEIAENSWLKEGMNVKAGQVIGTVLTVLKEDKGRPMSMLHFSMKQKGYDLLYKQGIYMMNIDPTMVLLQCKINSLHMEK